MNKRGFTLIELLAVIVILAIIALIATPIVLNIISDSKEKSRQISVEIYANTAATTLANYETKHSTEKADGTYTITEDGNLCNQKYYSCTNENIIKINMDGEKPISGTLIFDRENKSHMIIIYDLKFSSDGDKYTYPLNYVNETVTPDKCFDVDNNTITGYYCYEGNEKGYETITDVVIPSTINDVNIEILGTDSFMSKGLTSVSIPNTIKTISVGAFQSNASLTKVKYKNNTYTDYNELIEKFSDNNVTYDSTSFQATGLDNAPPECIIAGTKVTLSNGEEINVEDLTGEEELLTWNFDTGTYEANKIIFIHSDVEKEYKVINLYFSDNTSVGIVMEHGFFDLDLGKWIYLDYNSNQYIGHRFIKKTNDGWTTVKLTDVKIETKTTSVYSPISARNLNYYVNDMLSMSGGIKELLNIYEFNTDTLTYNKTKKIKDITKYGVFKYNEISNLIDKNVYYNFSLKDLNVAIGKNLITKEDIYRLINTYNKYNTINR